MPRGSSTRCTPRKHVREKGATYCDCHAVMVGLTAAKNAQVITILDSVQLDALIRMAAKHDG